MNPNPGHESPNPSPHPIALTLALPQTPALTLRITRSCGGALVEPLDATRVHPESYPEVSVSVSVSVSVHPESYPEVSVAILLSGHSKHDIVRVRPW